MLRATQEVEERVSICILEKDDFASWPKFRRQNAKVTTKFWDCYEYALREDKVEESVLDSGQGASVSVVKMSAGLYTPFGSFRGCNPQVIWIGIDGPHLGSQQGKETGHPAVPRAYL